jgi:death-on-curing protein
VSEPVWINEGDALALHDRLLGLDGGAAGVRDRDLLQSALARPQPPNAQGGDTDPIDLMAAYTVGVVRNRPFIDGNEPTGFVVGVLFLEINAYRFTAPEEEATQAVLGLAAGTLDEAAFAAWMRVNAKRP